MFGWNGVINALAALLCTLSQLYAGNLGLAIVTVSVLVRLALLPITIKMARHAHAQHRLMLKLKDSLAELRRKYKSNPQRLAEEMTALYQKHGVKPINGGSVAGGAVQFAVGAGLYSAIRRLACPGGRFLWITNLGRPDALLAILTGAITLAASALAPHLPQQSRFLASVLPAAMTVLLAWRLSSALVLYWAASAAMNGVQGVWVRRSA
jgi:YidC/Oxa1 family membrane protein insertase